MHEGRHKFIKNGIIFEEKIFHFSQANT